MAIRENYGNFLTEKRIEKGLTVKKLSEKSGVPERNIYAIEHERAKEYSLCNLSHLLEALDIPLSEVVK